MFVSLVVALLISLNAASGCASWEFSLARQANFTLRSCDGKYGPITGNVPGSVHMDLMRAEIIEVDPYFRYQERDLSWIPKGCWVYESTPFDIPTGQSDCLPHLRLKGVDSIATVSINGNELPAVVNAHRDHTFPLEGHLLKSHGNVLRIKFPSVLEYAKSQANKYPYSVPATQNYNVWAEPTSRNFVRKAGSDFGWDWGPAFVSMGISGDILLFEQPVAKLDDFVVTYTLAEDFSSARVEVAAVVTPTSSGTTSAGQQKAVSFSVSFDGHAVESFTSVSVNCPSSPCKLPAAAFTITNPALWWPRGWGEQALHTIQVRLADGSSNAPQTVSKKTGFRSVRLIQAPLAEEVNGLGSSSPNPATFYFEINGVPIYMSGANFIPIDSFKPRVLSSDRNYVLQAALESNMNMLRIWGGGIYQPDDFYEMADEQGVMLWQEVMLACALYPRDQAFLDEVTKEVKQQVVRLASHPSIVIFGGNNENEAALNWFTESNTNRDLYVSDYSQLYGNTIYPALLWALGSESLSHTVAWVDSSPSNGLISTDPYVKMWGTSNTAAAGDVHFYSYDCDCEDASSFPDAKFVSEFGFQSMPSFLAYEPVISAADYDPNSAVLQFRQRHEDGNSQIEAQIVKHFDLPARCASNKRYLDMYLYLTLIQQSNCYSTAMHHWRQLKGASNKASVSNNNMGILYWQLNDIWQGPSWSSMEWSGRWKPLQYAVKHIYEPLVVSLKSHVVNDSAVHMSVYVISDYAMDLQVLLNVDLRAWTGGPPVSLRSLPVMIPSQQSVLVDTLELSRAFLQSVGCDLSTCYLKAWASVLQASRLRGPRASLPLRTASEYQYQQLLSKQPNRGNGSISNAYAMLPLTVYKDISLPTSNYSIVISNVRDKRPYGVSFTLSSAVTAPYLFLEISNNGSSNNFATPGVYSQFGGWFSMNNFIAEKGVEYEVEYQSYLQPFAARELRDTLQVRSLQHVYDCTLSVKPTFA